MVEISTSILSVKSENAMQTFYNLEVAHTNYFHIDVMDGRFVEKDNRDSMKEYTNSIKQISSIPLDVHFMVEKVEEFIEEYLPLEPNRITFHYEAAKDKEEIKKWIQKIKENNVKVGIAIKPDTKVEEIYEFLPYIHMILIMTVEPGKGGQKLIPETIEKIGKLKKHLEENQIEVDIEADGGIGEQNIRLLEEKGLDIAVVGSSVISSQNYKETITTLKG